MSSWVQGWLTRGCDPSAHTLMAIVVQGNAAEARCVNCDRRYAATRTPCLICTNDGVHAVVLSHEPPRVVAIAGLLCNTCMTELSGGDAIAGWRAHATHVTADESRPAADDTRPAAPL